MSTKFSLEIKDFVQELCIYLGEDYGTKTKIITEVRNRFNADIDKNTVTRYSILANKQTDCIHIDADLANFIKSRYCKDRPLLMCVVREASKELNAEVSIRDVLKVLDRNYIPLVQPNMSTGQLVIDAYKKNRQLKNRIEQTGLDIQRMIGRKLHPNTIARYVHQHFPEDTRKVADWSEQELAILNNFAGFIPFYQVINKLDAYSKKHKIKRKTKKMIERKCSELGLSVDCAGVMLFETEVTEGLGVQKTRFRSWLADVELKNILKPIDMGNRTGFYPKDIARLIQEYPALIDSEKSKPEFLIKLIGMLR